MPIAELLAEGDVAAQEARVRLECGEPDFLHTVESSAARQSGMFPSIFRKLYNVKQCGEHACERL